MRSLGIDYGSKRVGIAISDEARQFALPLCVLANTDELLGEVARLCEENHIDTIIIG